MDDNQRAMFKMILEEVMQQVTEKELADIIDTFIDIYENKFGALQIEVEDTPEMDDVLHVNDASEYLQKFRSQNGRGFL
jgi:thymidylate synthase